MTSIQLTYIMFLFSLKKIQVENGTTWHNPEPPENMGREKDCANCPFYIKTGACKFGDR